MFTQEAFLYLRKSFAKTYCVSFSVLGQLSSFHYSKQSVLTTVFCLHANIYTLSHRLYAYIKRVILFLMPILISGSEKF